MDHDNRDDTILEGRIAGKSVMALAKKHRCSSTEVEAAVDRRLGYQLDNNMRRRMMKLHVARLEALIAPFFERATKARDVAAGTLCCKLLERQSLLLGLDSPTRVDIVQLQAQEAPTSYGRVREAIMRMARGPDWQPNGGDGHQPNDHSAVDALSDLDGKEPNH